MVDTVQQALNALSDTRFTTYWLDSLDPVADEAAPDQDTSCDLLIVGGGFCGLWAAIQAKEQNPDRDVVLIEAKSVANGASGRPAAIMSTSVMHGIDNTERIFPYDVAELEQLGRENMDGFLQTVERYGIDCDLEWGGEMKVSIGDEGLATVEEDYQLYLKYGHEAVKLDKAGMQAEIKSPLFHGGAWSKKRSGTVHPGKLVRGLKQAALNLGVRLY
jgi:glycine/D-amino acid oxidase-like deaminating enzyme